MINRGVRKLICFSLVITFLNPVFSIVSVAESAQINEEDTIDSTETHGETEENDSIEINDVEDENIEESQTTEQDNSEQQTAESGSEVETFNEEDTAVDARIATRSTSIMPYADNNMETKYNFTYPNYPTAKFTVSNDVRTSTSPSLGFGLTAIFDSENNTAQVNIAISENQNALNEFLQSKRFTQASDAYGKKYVGFARDLAIDFLSRSDVTSLSQTNNFNGTFLENGIPYGNFLSLEGLNPVTPGKTYYVWILRNFSASGGWQVLPYYGNGDNTIQIDGKAVPKPYAVTAPLRTLNIDAPTISQTSASRDGKSITMNAGSFSGEFVSTATGQVSLSTNNFSSVAKTQSNIVHTVPTLRANVGTYNQTTLTGLTPGTRYKAKMGLKTYGATNYTNSAASSYFYTANTMDGTPTVTSTTAATSATNAFATVKAKYNVGADPAHPSSILVKIKEEGGSFETVTSTTTPKSDSSSIDTTNKEVTVNLSKLKTNTNYQVTVSVKNASGVWSTDSAASTTFKTRGVALNISTPSLSDASTATEPRLQLAEGTYTGDPMVSGTSTDGFVRLYDSVGTSIDPITNLTSANGKYNATTLINGLQFGRRYTAAVWIRGSGNTREPSERSGYVYTINSVSTPSNVSYTIPTTSSSAGVSFDGSYGVSTLAADASHPKTSGVTDNFSFDGQTGVNVQIKSDQDSDYSVWRSIKNTSTAANPAYLSSVTVNEASKKVECSINNLKANTTYYVRYRVQNDSGKWSYFSSDSFTITTLDRANGLYVDSVPTFDFGLQQLSNGRMNLSLSHTNNAEALKVEIENVGITTGWAMAARMTPLTTQDGQTLTGAYLTFENELKSYSGGTWQPTTGVQQLTYGATTNVPATNATVSLYRTQSTNNGQGQHRLTIDPDTVKLVVPANVAHAGSIYTGNLTWTLDQLP